MSNDTLLAAKIAQAEAAMQANLARALYGGPREGAGDPRFAPPTAVQLSRMPGFYWVRDRDAKGAWCPWRIDEWSRMGWATCGNEEVWMLEPDEVGPRAVAPD